MRRGAIVIAAGAGLDISFDLAMQATFNATVWIVDPTPFAIDHVSSVFQAARAGQTDMPIPGCPPDEVYPLHEIDPSCLIMIPKGLWGECSPQDFYKPHPSLKSCSILDIYHGEGDIGFRAECITIIHLMHIYELPRIDLLKLDIEGAEYAVLANVLADGIRPTQICVEFHVSLDPQPHEHKRVRDALSQLTASGYDLIDQQGPNFTFAIRNASLSP